MKIGTQLIIIFVIFIIALLIIAGSVISTNQHLDRLNKQQILANNIEIAAGELGYLSNDYLLYHESQQLDRWNSKYASFSADLSNLNVDTPEQQVLVDNMRANRQRLKNVFDDVVTTIESSNTEPKKTIDSGYIQVSWSRIAVQNRGIIFDASRLSQMLRDEEDRVRQTNTLFIAGVMGTFVLFLLANYLLVYRHTLKAIASLQTGTKIIGSGNLDYTIDVRGRNEISELARAFNQMTSHLKTVTASKAELEKEVIERKQAEEALKDAKMQAELYVDLMGHDINNLNQSAMGYLELALETLEQEGNLSNNDKDLLGKPLKALNSSSVLIDNVRKLQRLVSEGVKTSPVDLSGILQSIDLEAFQSDGRDITINIPAIPHYFVEASELLKDVFFNLISNAVKHSDEAKPLTVSVKVEPVTDNDLQYYQCSIEDNGPGIPDAVKGKLFHRFQRGATKAHGKGLGLYLVRMLIESYHGRVWVEDRVPGDYSQGARFVIQLPAAEK
ncbi:ATP-binding protein [Methanocella sp. MCL-LM]|uniref:HAMP domain-containing sensor histidine kinase n=1 Tax=Methanocella sp. MCL-LM TaxID=3412035 RepID=UPI003C77CA99